MTLTPNEINGLHFIGDESLCERAAVEINGTLDENWTVGLCVAHTVIYEEERSVPVAFNLVMCPGNPSDFYLKKINENEYEMYVVR